MSTIRESLNQWAPWDRTYKIKGKLVRCSPLAKELMEANEATRRDIRNGARMCGESFMQFEPTGHPRPAFDEDEE
jgi:hypothetical protein